jgi:hypothetical protein
MPKNERRGPDRFEFYSPLWSGTWAIPAGTLTSWSQRSNLIGFSVVAGRAIARRGRKLGGEENRVIHSHIRNDDRKVAKIN